MQFFISCKKIFALEAILEVPRKTEVADKNIEDLIIQITHSHRIFP